MQNKPGGLIAYQSDRVEELVDKLFLELVQEERRNADTAADRPFVEHLVVIPTRNLETYLTFELAARRGIAAGIEFCTMESFLGTLLPTDDDGELTIRLLDQIALTRMVLSLFDDPDIIADPDLKAVRDFIVPFDDASAEVIERRKYQLSFRVARLFEEYGYARQTILRHWRDGEPALDIEYPTEEISPAHLEIERWQMSLFQKLFGPDGLAHNLPDAGDDRPFMTLPDALLYFERADDHHLQWPDMVHLFGHSYLPRFFRDLFSTRTMAEDAHIALYVMNPCLEYWSHGIAGDRDEDPVFEILSAEDVSPLEGDEYVLPLAVWGRAGRDYQRMIDAIAYDRSDISLRHKRTEHTLLQYFQTLIRDMGTAHRAFEHQDLPGDEKSINFWSCSSVQRECEAIASEIWELVTTHDDLRFNDIGVVVQGGERSLYQTHLEAAFAQTGQIPCNIIDVEGSQTSPFLEAAELLLKLPLGQFRRRELLALLVHPNTVANYPEADDDAWMQWCHALNIFQGGHRDDLDATYLDEDRFTWSQGMRRLVLGAFMSQPDPGRPQPLEFGGEQYLPHETNHGDIDTVAVLTMLADELIADARRARSQKRSLRDWMDYFSDQISRHVEPRDRRERRTRMRFIGALSDIADADTCPDDKVGYRTAFDFAMMTMEELEETRGQYLADGVVVSAFRPMRPIPFEVTFITGLGEGKFPAPDPPDMLDLRRVKSEAHDVNPRYSDQYMFLETLISTRSRLYLSWVGSHAITGDPIEPASVVHQFREMILAMAPNHGERARRIRDELARRVKYVEHPLRRYDERYFPQIFADEDESDAPEVIDARGPDAIPTEPESVRGDAEQNQKTERIWPNHHREARREAQVRAIRNNLDKSLPAGHRPTMDQLRAALEDGVFFRLADILKWNRPDARRRDGDGETIVLQLHHLRHFLQDPLQGSARAVLRLYSEDDGDVLDIDHEPFQAGFLTRLMLVRRAIESALVAGNLSDDAIIDVFDQQARAAELTGELPAGVFFEAERDKCIEQLRTYARALGGKDFDGRLRRIRFGGARQREEIDEVFAPLTFNVDTGDRTFNVELHGKVQVLEGSETGSLVFAAGKRPKAKHLVDGGLGQLMLCAADVESDGSATVITTKGKAEHRSFSNTNPDQARRYLHDLTAELLDGVHDYFLPVELVDDLVNDKVDHYDQHAQKKKEPAYGRDTASVSTVYGPVRRWQDVDPPPRDQAGDIIERRFAPFIDAFKS